MTNFSRFPSSSRIPSQVLSRFVLQSQQKRDITYHNERTVTSHCHRTAQRLALRVDSELLVSKITPRYQLTYSSTGKQRSGRSPSRL